MIEHDNMCVMSQSMISDVSPNEYIWRRVLKALHSADTCHQMIGDSHSLHGAAKFLVKMLLYILEGADNGVDAAPRGKSA